MHASQSQYLVGTSPPRAATTVTDYDIHGVLGVRLIDATPADRAVVEGQIGSLRGSLRRTPDITIRFVDRIPTNGLRFVEVERSGFTDTDFLIRSNGRRSAWVRVPFETLGDPSEFVCERGVRLVPLLKPALRLAALRKGYVPFHASAFEWQGNGILVAGWTHGGKTSALLAFAAQGARFVGDELVLLSPEGRTMAGLPCHFRLTDGQLDQLPHLRGAARPAHRLMVTALQRLQRFTSPGAGRSAVRGRPVRLVNAAAREAEARFKTRVEMEAVFPAGCPLRGEPRRVFLMSSDDGRGITVERLQTREIADRMAHSLRYEDLPLLSQYLAFRFAFPKRRNLAIETMHEAERALLPDALAGLSAYGVRHPYPAPFASLFETMRPYCTAERPVKAGSPRELVLR